MQLLSPKELFLNSLARCTESPEFLADFYRRFTSSSKEIEIRFVNPDFEKLQGMLLRSLQLTAAATTGDSEGLRELRARAESHDRDHLNIRPHLYDLWRTSLIETARDYDDEWDDDVEDAWNRILGHVINQMTRYY